MKHSSKAIRSRCDFVSFEAAFLEAALDSYLLIGARQTLPNDLAFHDSPLFNRELLIRVLCKAGLALLVHQEDEPDSHLAALTALGTFPKISKYGKKLKRGLPVKTRNRAKNR